jgi:hypothetical protein
MSFWFRNRPLRPAPDPSWTALGALAVLAGGAAEAAETYIQPQAYVATEVDSNRDLLPSGPYSSAEGYGAMAGATVGIATPDSDTTIKPVLTYFDFPQLHESDIRSITDFNASYNGQRVQAGISGRFDYSDLFDSELPAAAFNTVNPNLPTTPETARISLNGTRTLVTAVPTFSYGLTQRLDAQVTGIYQDVSYGGVGSQQYIDYQYFSGSAGLDWKLTPRSDIGLLGDVSHQSSKDVFSVTDGHGATLTYNYQWSKVFTGSLQLVGEQDNIHNATVFGAKTASNITTSTTGFGAQYQTTWKGQISEVQVTLGRTFTPNGSGGKYKSDAFQGEYKRSLTQRLTLDTAVHYIRNISLSNLFTDGNYDYLIATADIKYMLARTWYVGGGLQYIYTSSPIIGAAAGTPTSIAAKDAMAHISFGYLGLGRQY